MTTVIFSANCNKISKLGCFNPSHFERIWKCSPLCSKIFQNADFLRKTAKTGSVFTFIKIYLFKISFPEQYKIVNNVDLAR